MSATRYRTGSWQGIDRQKNKDAICVLRKGSHYLFVVFDGVSSTPDAREVIAVVIKHLREHYDDLLRGQTSLAELFYDANEKVLSRSITDGSSTYVALFFDSKENDGIISSLGDSRIYSTKRDEVRQLTRDDSLELGSNIITKGLGFEDMKQSDFTQRSIAVKDRSFLLCSDGFYDFLESDTEKVLRILRSKNLDSVQKSLKRMVVESNSDDATYALVRT